MSNAAATPFSLDVRVLIDATVIDIRGGVDIGTSPALQLAIESAETQQQWHIVVSFERCTYCDSTGLSILARAKKRLSDRFLVVVPKSNAVRRVFDVTHVAEYLTVFESVEEARHLFAGPAKFTESKKVEPEG